ncbi:MAG TPA: hypothetical protein ENJ95_19525 [Bacteroidetes bacterium]|nr:hypothetical protein [Bacteroidota bacterium]
MKNKILFLLLASSIFAQAAFAGGGWPQPKGAGYFKLSEWWLISDRHFTDAGRIDPNTTFGLYNTSLYAEYGFTDRLTGLLYLPLFSRAYFNNSISNTTGETLVPGEAINSIGDADLGIKYGLTLNRPIALSATLMLGLPLGNDSGGSQGNLQTGDGEFNQLLQIDAGTGFALAGASAYANVYIGANNRSNGFSDELRYGIEGGLTFLKEKLTVIARLYGIESFKNGDLPAERSNSTSIFANNSEHLTFSPEIAFKLNDKWGIAAGFGTALRGELIFADPAYSFGVFYNLKR